MEIKRVVTQKPEFCGEKKPMINRKKNSKKLTPVNKIRQTSYVSDLQGQQGYVTEEDNVRSSS